MKKVTLMLVLVIMLFSSCDRGSTDNGSSAISSSSLNTSLSNSSASESEPLTSETTSSKTKVTFEEVKDDLVGGYHYADAAIYSYNYLFFENGNYIVIDLFKNRYTNENSTVSYFIREGESEEEIVIELERNDGKELVLYGTAQWLTYEGDPVGGVKTPDIVCYSEERKESRGVVSYSLDLFDGVEIGKTTVLDMFHIAKSQHLVYLTPIGDVSEYPLDNGKFLRVTYDEGLIVKSIEVVDELCEVYY